MLSFIVSQSRSQLEPRRTVVDPQALRDPRPDTRTETAVDRLLGSNPFQTGSSGSGVITVFERSHNRGTSDVVVFKKVEAFDGITRTSLESTTGYTITVVDANSYTFTVTDNATVGNTRGGGDHATSGPRVAASVASTFDSTSVTLDSTNKTFDEA